MKDLTDEERGWIQSAGHLLVDYVDGEWRIVPIGGMKSAKILRRCATKEEAVAFVKDQGVAENARLREGIQTI